MDDSPRGYVGPRKGGDKSFKCAPNSVSAIRSFSAYSERRKARHLDTSVAFEHKISSQESVEFHHENKHEKSPGRFYCPHPRCGYAEGSFVGWFTEKELETHVASKHELSSKAALQNRSLGYCCPVPGCDVPSFSLQASLEFHLRRKHGKTPGRFYCPHPQCAYAVGSFLGWITEKELETHVLYAHPA
jgi:hypothetical protein